MKFKNVITAAPFDPPAVSQRLSGCVWREKGQRLAGGAGLPGKPTSGGAKMDGRTDKYVANVQGREGRRLISCQEALSE